MLSKLRYLPQKVYFQLMMSGFSQILNPIKGQCEWQLICDDYDYHQEIVVSGFADMLHDTERNKKYYKAIKKAIDLLHAQGKVVDVLDIGTGTGILAMMAVRCGADTVTACEAFRPMADCAQKIIEQNGMAEKINLIKKRSTDISIGNDGDMEKKANLLVTEVFDTELIGEGAISIFNHAHEHLLTDDCVVVPHSSMCYAQIVESPLCSAFNKPKLVVDLDAKVLLKTPDDIVACEGDAAIQDIQLSQFPISSFKIMSNTIPIFDFNFSKKEPLPKNRSKQLKVAANKSGQLQAIFFWWDLKMDAEGEILISCAPYWAHPDREEYFKNRNIEKPIQNIVPWRDHWMQGVYYFHNEIFVNENQEFYFYPNHDEYSFWFHASNQETEEKIDRWKCSCGFHLAFSRTRIGQINNNSRNKKYLRLLENVINENSNVLIISDGSLLGLSTAKLGAKRVNIYEPHTFSRGVIELYIKKNNLTNIKIYKTIDELEEISDITHVIGEPAFITSILPWDNFYFGTILQKLKPKLTENTYIIPLKAHLYAIPLEFIDLYKIRSPLGDCEGFNLSLFDELVEKSTLLTDATVEAQPLWEYPGKVLGNENLLFTIDFENFKEEKDKSGQIEIGCSGICNGIALWVNWDLDGTGSRHSLVTTGNTEPIEVGKYISWDMFSRQGVHIIQHPKTTSQLNTIQWNVKFQPSTGELKFKFNI